MGHIYPVGKQNSLFDLQNYCICREDKVHTKKYCDQDKRFPRDTPNNYLNPLPKHTYLGRKIHTH